LEQYLWINLWRNLAWNQSTCEASLWIKSLKSILEAILESLIFEAILQSICFGIGLRSK
jgi:hypothetical protein